MLAHSLSSKALYLQSTSALLVVSLGAAPSQSSQASFVVREQTGADLYMLERTLENVHKLPSSLVNSHRSRNAVSYTLDRNLDVEPNYVMLSQEVFDEICCSPIRKPQEADR